MKTVYLAAILLINFESEVNIPLLVDFAGEVEAIDFSFGEKTEVEASCSTVYQGEQLIIGGWNERNQVRVLSSYENYDKTYLTQSSIFHFRSVLYQDVSLIGRQILDFPFDMVHVPISINQIKTRPCFYALIWTIKVVVAIIVEILARIGIGF